MSQVNFFANTQINLNQIQYPTIFYPAPQTMGQDIFTVPEHNVGTPNLLVFVNGILQHKDIHYQDINSYQIKFITPPDPTHDIYTVLLISNEGNGEIQNIEWEDF